MTISVTFTPHSGTLNGYTLTANNTTLWANCSYATIELTAGDYTLVQSDDSNYISGTASASDLKKYANAAVKFAINASAYTTSPNFINNIIIQWDAFKTYTGFDSIYRESDQYLSISTWVNAHTILTYSDNFTSTLDPSILTSEGSVVFGVILVGYCVSIPGTLVLTTDFAQCIVNYSPISNSIVSTDFRFGDNIKNNLNRDLTATWQKPSTISTDFRFKDFIKQQITRLTSWIYGIYGSQTLGVSSTIVRPEFQTITIDVYSGGCSPSSYPDHKEGPLPFIKRAWVCPNGDWIGFFRATNREVKYCRSMTGKSWTIGTTPLDTLCMNFSTWLHGSTFELVGWQNPSTALVYTQGIITPSTITWNNRQTLLTSFTFKVWWNQTGIGICTDDQEYPWILYQEAQTLLVTTSNNINGTWSTRTGFPKTIINSTIDLIGLPGMIFPMGSQDTYVFYFNDTSSGPMRGKYISRTTIGSEEIPGTVYTWSDGASWNGFQDSSFNVWAIFYPGGITDNIRRRTPGLSGTWSPTYRMDNWGIIQPAVCNYWNTDTLQLFWVVGPYATIESAYYQNVNLTSFDPVPARPTKMGMSYPWQEYDLTCSYNHQYESWGLGRLKDFLGNNYLIGVILKYKQFAIKDLSSSHFLKNLVSRYFNNLYKGCGIAWRFLSSIYKSLTLSSNSFRSEYFIKVITNNVTRTINNIKTNITKSYSSLYKILSITLIDFNAKYNIKVNLAKLFISLNNIKTNISKSFVEKYNILSKLFNSYRIQFNLIGTITDDFESLYRILNNVSISKSLLYKLKTNISTSFKGVYSILSRTYSDFRIRFGLLGKILTSLISSYKIKNNIQSTFRLVYTSFSRIVSLINVRFNIKNNITKEIRVLYKLLNNIFTLKNILYVVKTNIATLIRSRYDVLSRTFLNFRIKFGIPGRVFSSLISSYNIKNIIQNTFRSLNNIRQNISTSLKGTYNILSRVFIILTGKFNLRVLITRLFTLKHLLKVLTTKLFNLEHLLRTSISRSLNSIYKMLMLRFNKLSLMNPFIGFDILEVTTNPIKVIRTGIETTQLRCDWYDLADLNIENYKCKFWVRDVNNNIYGSYEGSIVKEAPKQYHATFDLDPDETFQLGNYDIKVEVIKYA